MTSSAHNDWHEDVDLWEKLSGVIFRKERVARTSQEVDDIIRLLDLKSDEPVLDLCCGIGRHALELARRGYRVTGVDSNPSFLERARSHAEQERLAVEWILGDMRRFEQPLAYRAVLNLFSSFGYFKDPKEDALVLAHVFRSLQPGGKILIEGKGKEILERTYRPVAEHQLEDMHVKQEVHIDKANSWVTDRWTVTERGKQRTLVIGYRLYSAADLTALLKAAGFTDISVYGSLAGAPYDDTASNLVVVARKPS